jgi:hypothetical protein
MKKVFLATIMAGVLFLTFHMTSNAMEISALDGNSYNVFIYCENEAGDFCDATLEQDEFSFDSGSFEMKRFQDEFFGYGAEGEYNENGFIFQAHYKVIDERIEEYEISVTGINVLDNIIFGILRIKYSQLSDILDDVGDIIGDIFDDDDDDDDEKEATAYFVGLKN